MKIKVALPLIISALVLAGCTNKASNANKGSNNSQESSSITSDSTSESSEKSRDYEEKEIEFTLEPFMPSAQSSYTIPVTYKRSSFISPSTTFDKDLAMLSFGLSASSGVKRYLKAFYEDLDFDEIILSDSYSAKPTQDSVAYAIAHRKVAGNDLVAVSLRSNNYFNEWANNFELGSEGNHVGFEKSSQIVFDAVDSYLKDKNYNNANTKVWVTGYSRGAAQASMVADKIMRNDSLVIKTENLYVYTFEAPRAFSLDNVVKYENVHNVFNSADLVASFAPEGYGLYHTGKEYDTYSENVQEYLNELNPNLVLPELNLDGVDYTNDIEHVTSILNHLLKDDDFAEDNGFKPYCPTREDFANKYQAAIVNAINLYFSLSENTKAKIQEGFNNLTMLEKLYLMMEDGIYNFLKPYIEADGVEYDDAVLRATCNRLLEFIKYPGSSILSEAMAYTANLQRMLYFHTLEVNYVLLKNYEFVK